MKEELDLLRQAATSNRQILNFLAGRSCGDPRPMAFDPASPRNGQPVTVNLKVTVPCQEVPVRTGLTHDEIEDNVAEFARVIEAQQTKREYARETVMHDTFSVAKLARLEPDENGDPDPALAAAFLHTVI